jgi:phosphoglycolate phosphatase
MPERPAAIFDLDGTLIDSAPDLAGALNRVLARSGLPALPLEAVRGMVGDGAKALVARGFQARGRTAEARDLADFLADYEANAVVETRLYPGIEDALRALARAGHRLGICTNKPERATRLILSALDLDRFFPVVIGGDSTGFRKPDPQPLLAARAALGAERAAMIGDHENDILAARGSAMASIFAAWGYGTARGDYLAHSPAELPGLMALMGRE